MTGNRRQLAVGDIPIERMITPFTDENTSIPFKVLDQLGSIHQKLKDMV